MMVLALLVPLFVIAVALINIGSTLEEINKRERNERNDIIKEFAERVKWHRRQDIAKCKQGLLPLSTIEKAYDNVMVLIDRVAKEMIEKGGD